MTIDAISETIDFYLRYFRNDPNDYLALNTAAPPGIPPRRGATERTRP
jgi:hypothetical protein